LSNSRRQIPVLEVAVRSDTGRRRDGNEDSTAIDTNNGLLLVADGMGGYRAGEVASAIAITATVRSTRSGLSANNYYDPEQFSSKLAEQSHVFGEALQTANDLIVKTAREEPVYEGMGTTIVGLLFHGNRVSVGNVGDSRAYRYRGNHLLQLTRDHTVLEEMVSQGIYTEEEANRSINRNLVTRALGVEPVVRVDVNEFETVPGDIYMLCSDGLNDMVNDRELIEELAKTSDHSTELDSVAEALVSRANENGGDDNISVLLARVTQHRGRGALSTRLRHWVGEMRARAAVFS